MLSVALRLVQRLTLATIRRFRIVRRIDVTLLGPRADIALVRIRHGLLARLAFSEPETDLVVCAVHAPFGGRQWLDDARMRIVTDRGVIAALEREWKRAAHDRINSECWAAMQAIVDRRA